MGVETPSRARMPTSAVTPGVRSSAPKPDPDFTDLLPVTTATLKSEPLAGADSANDLLGTIVREHLDRASARPPIHPGPRQPAEVPAPASEPVAELAEVQQQFDALFNAAQDAPKDETKVTATADASRLSREEMDALLSEHAPADAGLPLEPEAAQAIADAEGVLQEELSQLMPQESAAGEAKAEPPSEPPAPSARSAPAAPRSLPMEAAGPVVAETRPAPAAFPPPVIIETAIVEEEPEAAAPRPSIFRNLLLTLAELVNLPLVWVPEADRHIIGIATLLLFLGGAGLILLAKWLEYYQMFTGR